MMKRYLATTALCLTGLVGCSTLTEAPADDVVSTTLAVKTCGFDEYDASTDETVRIECNLTFPKDHVASKSILIKGAERGLVVDCNGGTIEGNIWIKSDEPDEELAKDPHFNWKRPKNITIRNCTIEGYVRLVGLGKTGEGEFVYWSSLHANHTAHAQASAPTNISLDNLTIKGTGGIPLYLGPGVTHVSLTSSHIAGRSDSVAIYLDTESGHNLFKDNLIDTETTIGGGGRELVAIDGSAFNRFIDNKFSNLDRGGIYLYRNSGEGPKEDPPPRPGTVRHQPPSYNQFIENYFYYDKYDGELRAIHIGAREGNRKNYRDDDKGYPYGSSVNDRDLAHHNVMVGNRVKKLDHIMMLKNSIWATYTVRIDNETVDDDYRDSTTSPCYVPYADSSGLLKHGKTIHTLNIDGQPRCLKYEVQCNDGILEMNGKAVEPYDLPSAIGGWDLGRVDGGRAVLFEWDLWSSYRTLTQAYPGDFNAFVFGNIVSIQNAEGAIAAGRNITLTDVGINQRAREITGVVAGGSLAVKTGTLTGNVYVGDDSPLPPNVAITGVLQYGRPIDFTMAKRKLRALATDLANATYPKKQQGETIVNSRSWGTTITFEGNNDGLNTFRVKGKDLSKASSINLSIPDDGYALITVTHGSGNDGLAVSLNDTGINLGSTAPRHVLWNMHRTTSVKLSGTDFVGSLLAPKAHVRLDNRSLTGTVVAASLRGNGALQHAPFDPWHDFRYSEDNSCSYPRGPFRDSNEYEFECSVEGSNQGCSKAIACPAGTVVSNVKAACHLERSSLSKDALDDVEWTNISVIHKSTDVSDGVCRVGGGAISSGTATIDGSFIGKRYFDIHCHEYDKNGGDCTIIGRYQCGVIALPW